MSIQDIRSTAEQKLPLHRARCAPTCRRSAPVVRSAGLLDHVLVDYYGTPTPVPQVAQRGPRRRPHADRHSRGRRRWSRCHREGDPRHATWASTPRPRARLVRVPMPMLTEERRKELTKVVKGEGENARVAVRNMRRDANAACQGPCSRTRRSPRTTSGGARGGGPEDCTDRYDRRDRQAAGRQGSRRDGDLGTTLSRTGSSTSILPRTTDLPRHIAIIMDGNGRWARKRLLPRAAGHKAGLGAVRAVVKGCAERGVGFLTLFAFSSENWRRPAEEVGFLMRLFLSTLDREVSRLHRNNVRFRAIGAVEAFGDEVVSAHPCRRIPAPPATAA
jgi:hypothetical protein